MRVDANAQYARENTAKVVLRTYMTTNFEQCHNTINHRRWVEIYEDGDDVYEGGTLWGTICECQCLM